MTDETVPPEGLDHEGHLEFIREVLAFLRHHADELREKGLPIDDMIKDLEAKLAEVLALGQKVLDLQTEDRLLTAKREHLRRDVDGIVAGLPPDLVDGMATIEYLDGAFKRHVERRRRGKKGVGG